MMDRKSSQLLFSVNSEGASVLTTSSGAALVDAGACVAGGGAPPPWHSSGVAEEVVKTEAPSELTENNN
jgi:hypothetical protein